MSQLLLAGSLAASQAAWGGVAIKPEGLAAGVLQAGSGEWAGVVGSRGTEFTGGFTDEAWRTSGGGAALTGALPTVSNILGDNTSGSFGGSKYSLSKDSLNS